jgi:hypothetical protein
MNFLMIIADKKKEMKRNQSLVFQTYKLLSDKWLT